MIEAAIKANDTLYLSLGIYEVANARGVVQMIHGTRDYKGRYQEFISWLNANGFSVVIADLRGHGKSINSRYPLGYMENIQELIDDQVVITNYIKNRFPYLPIYMLGIGFGSVIARLYLEKHASEIKKLVLCSPIAFNDEVKMGLKVGKVLTKVNGKNKGSDTLNSYLNLDKDNYICTRQEIMNAFHNDTLCTFRYTNQALMTMLEAIAELHAKKSITTDPNFSILLVCGFKDPVEGGISGREDTVNSLKLWGLINIKTLVYPDMMYDILNEINREQVYFDIIKFLIS